MTSEKQLMVARGCTGCCLDQDRAVGMSIDDKARVSMVINLKKYVSRFNGKLKARLQGGLRL
jgi:hypothetical protein